MNLHRMARSSSWALTHREPLHSYWVEDPFFSFGLVRFRRAMLAGHKRLGWGVVGLQFAHYKLRRRFNRRAYTLFPYAIPFTNSLWNVSTTFKYPALQPEGLTYNQDFCFLPNLEAIKLYQWPTLNPLGLTYEQYWVGLREVTWFSVGLIEAEQLISQDSFDSLTNQYFSCYYLFLIQTF